MGKKLTAAITTILLTMGAAQANLLDGLSANWTFDEGTGTILYDQAGLNHGTIYGAVWATGLIENALIFDGVNDHVSIPASSSLNFAQSYTIAAWLRPTENPTSAMVWFGYHGGSPYGSNNLRSIHLRIYPNGIIRCGLYGDALNTTPGLVTFGEWNHIVFSYDYSADTAAIYVNGQMKTTGAMASYVGGLRTGTIGKWDVPFQSQEHFKGLMDEFSVYHRALSAQEVDALYQIGMPELLGIELVGPDQAAERFSTQYKAIAFYADGNSRDVTNYADWYAEPETIATVSRGLLKVGTVDLPSEITLTAQYGPDANVRQAQKTVSVNMICGSGNALHFDGVNDYAETGFVLNPAEGSFSAFAWVKGGSSATGIICQFDNNPGDAETGRAWLYVNAQSRLATQLRAGGGQDLTSDTAWDPSSWHFAGVVWNAETGTRQLYLDGMQINADTTSIGALEPCTGNMLFGTNVMHSAGFWGGLMDDIRIYNKALSSTEVQLVMHMPPDSKDPALAGYWAFNEGQGQVALDTSAYGNHGTLGSSPDVDDNDPAWIESDAPIGVCEPEGIVERNLLEVRNRKQSILEQLYETIAQETALVDYMDAAYRSCKHDKADRNAMMNVKRKVTVSIGLEKLAGAVIDRSVDNIDEAINDLAAE